MCSDVIRCLSKDEGSIGKVESLKARAEPRLMHSKGVFHSGWIEAKCIIPRGIPNVDCSIKHQPQSVWALEDVFPKTCSSPCCNLDGTCNEIARSCKISVVIPVEIADLKSSTMGIKSSQRKREGWRRVVWNSWQNSLEFQTTQPSPTQNHQSPNHYVIQVGTSGLFPSVLLILVDE